MVLHFGYCEHSLILRFPVPASLGLLHIRADGAFHWVRLHAELVLHNEVFRKHPRLHSDLTYFLAGDPSCVQGDAGGAACIHGIRLSIRLSVLADAGLLRLGAQLSVYALRLHEWGLGRGRLHGDLHDEARVRTDLHVYLCGVGHVFHLKPKYDLC